jgi:peptidylprolyl isomerase
MNETPSKPESPDSNPDPAKSDTPTGKDSAKSGRDPKVAFLAGAAVLLAIVIGAVLIFGGGPAEVDNSDLATKPVIEAGEGDPPTEVVTEDIVEGEGPGAKEGDTLTVQYVGALFETAEEFDASWDRGEPFDVTLGQGQVIQGWEQGLIGMKAGGRREIIIPSELGYGSTGSPPTIPPDAALIFIVDLEKIAKGQ